MFIEQTSHGTNYAAKKTFQTNLHTYLNQKFEQRDDTLHIEMAFIFNAIYQLDKDAAFEFMMSTTDRKAYSKMHAYLTDEAKRFIKEKAQKRVQNYVKNQQNNNTATTNTARTGKQYEYDNYGFYAIAYKYSNYKIFFPPVAISYDYNPLYLPKMRYKFNDVSTSIVKDLDYKKGYYKNTWYASVRMTPNIYGNFAYDKPLLEWQSMVLYAVAANHLFPSSTYTQAKKAGDIYVITSDVTPISGSNNYIAFSQTLIMKAHKGKGSKELIIQMVKTSKPVHNANDLTAEERHFLNNCVVNIK